MTKTLIMLMSLATLAGHSLSASAESCPPTSRVLMRITGDDNLQYLTSRTSFDEAEEALGTSWNADATALAAHAFRIATLPVVPLEPSAAIGFSPEQSDLRPLTPRPVDARPPTSAAVSVTGVAASGRPADPVVSQPASAAAVPRRSSKP